MFEVNLVKSRIRYFLGIPLLLLLFSGCEKDDICVETSLTPNLIIRFYDQVNISQFKEVPTLRVIGVGSQYILIDRITTDSISIPLKTLENTTSFMLINASEEELETGNSDVLTITYTPKEIFINRACGYKMNFEEANGSVTTDEANWIQDVQIINPNIQNERKAHIHLYH